MSATDEVQVDEVEVSVSSSGQATDGRGGVVRHDDLVVGEPRLVRVDGRRLCLVRTGSGVHAIDHACPHEGYGMTQGTVEGELITCAWHNWKFRVSDGSCVRGEEDIGTHGVRVADDGAIEVDLHERPPEQRRATLRASLRRGIANDYVGQVSRDVVRLLRASDDPGELVWEAVAHGAPRHEFGWGHSIAAATDCLAMVDQYEGDQRALPVVQAIAGISEPHRHRPKRPLPDPVRRLPGAPAAAFRSAVEAEELEGAQALVLGGIEAGLAPAELQRWFTGAVSDHHLSYGHGAIYAQKAFQLLEHVGWERAATVLPHLVPSLVWGTREDVLPYMAPFMRALADVDVPRLSEMPPAGDWEDDGTLRRAILDRDRTAPLTAAVRALRDGAGVHGILDTVVAAVSERLLRYDIDNEFVLDDDFNWLAITHGLTYANAARWHHDRSPGPDTLRLTLFCVFLAHWTGRHEWHTGIAAPAEPGPDTADLRSALLDGDPGRAVAAAWSTEPRRAGIELQQAALADRTTAPIVHAHAVKTSRVATEEAVRTGSALPVAATARFLAAPKLERFVAATVRRSVDLVSRMEAR